TLPLIVPGPHIVTTFVPGNPVTNDNLVLNKTVNAIDVVFDRDMDPNSFLVGTGPTSTSAGTSALLRLFGPTGLIPLFDPTTAAPLPGATITPDPTANYPRLINGDPTFSGPDPDPAHPRTFQIGLPTRASSLSASPGQDLSGTYNLTLGPVANVGPFAARD